MERTKKLVLVTGASGTIGTRLVQGLIQRGFAVRALVLPKDPGKAALAETGCSIVEGDVTDYSSLGGAFDNVETVYHMAAIILAQNPKIYESVNVQGTINMLRGASEAAVKHFIYISSASVVYPKTTPYSRSKRECERLVCTQGTMEFSIIRPTLVYDEYGGQEFVAFWDALKKFPVVPFPGNGRALKKPVHVNDLVQGLVAVADNPKARGKTYNLSGGEEITIRELANLMLEYGGGKKFFVHVPRPVCQGVAIALHKVMKTPPLTMSAIAGLTQDANLDTKQAEEDLDYHPLGVREGFRQCFTKGEHR